MLVRGFGLDINAKYRPGSTSLHKAPDDGQMALAKRLVMEFGADVNAKAEIDDDENLVSYRRVRSYSRGQGDKGGGGAR